MQDQYVGDIGDFGKYGLLRELTGVTSPDSSQDQLRLGVVWYRFPNKATRGSNKPGNRDGSLTSYLCNPKPRDSKLRQCDTELYSKLYEIVAEKKDRRLALIQESGILPSHTSFYDQPLPNRPEHSLLSLREAREWWLQGALVSTACANLVFMDPDNGIASEKTPFGSPKHVFPDELHRFFERDQSLVIYHHLTRQGKAPEQINNFAERLRGYLGRAHKLWALQYRRGTGRVYFIVAREQHRAKIWGRLKEFENKPCWFDKQPGFPHPHFQCVT